MQITSMAREGAEAFEAATRPDGMTFYRVKDGAPEWIMDLLHRVHDDRNILPDDTLYKLTYEALDWIRIDDSAEPDDAAFADSCVDVYTSELIAWLGAGPHVTWADEATETYGPSDILQTISRGQYLQAAHVFGVVVGFLQEQDN